MHRLYRHYDEDGILLYVGESINAISRLYQHTREAKWADDIRTVTIEVFPSRDEAIEAETSAIQSERPLYNIKLTARRGFYDQDREALIKEAIGIGINVDYRWSTNSLRIYMQQYNPAIDGKGKSLAR